MADESLKCTRCGRPVVSQANHYHTFERMHWVCFHLEFEHQGDPDEPCGDPSCFWRVRREPHDAPKGPA